VKKNVHSYDELKKIEKMPINEFKKLLKDEETYIDYPFPNDVEVKFNGAIFVKLKEGIFGFFYTKESFPMEGKIKWVNAILGNQSRKMTQGDVNALNKFEEKTKKEIKKWMENEKKIKDLCKEQRIRTLLQTKEVSKS